jgi:predicted hotdog family 3-hydroxylacyl-ACP dehydratase
MRMLDRIRACDGDTLEAEATLRADNPFVQGERVGASALLELMGQAAAAWVGWHAHARGEAARPGYLVNVRELRVEVATLPVGAALEVRVDAKGGDEGLRHFEGEVRMAGGAAEAARATFAVFQAPAEDAPEEGR